MIIVINININKSQFIIEFATLGGGGGGYLEIFNTFKFNFGKKKKMALDFFFVLK
jgi:hypothetical protein